MSLQEAPDTLTYDNAEDFIVYLRLLPSGLTFSGYRPGEKGSFFHIESAFDRSRPYLQALQEYCFTHEFMTFSFKKTYILPVLSPYTLVPSPVYDSKKRKELLAFAYAKAVGKALHNEWKENQVEIVFSMDQPVYEFCCRTFLNPGFIHPVYPQLTLWKKQSLACLPKQMYVSLQRKGLDIACYDRGQLLFCNAFRGDDINDILFYILTVWKQAGMDSLGDQLRLTGDMTRCSQITEALHHYLQYIAQVEIPPQVFSYGDRLAQAPFDLIAATVREA